MIKRFLRDETGLELSEYAVAAALVALACVAAFRPLGTNIRHQDQRTRRHHHRFDWIGSNPAAASRFRCCRLQ